MRELIVLSCAHSQTVLSKGQSRRRYLPFGWCGPSATSTSLNGQWKERSAQQIYLFGNGYRPYFPTLGRFSSPDKLSPFSKGGINAYGYAAQDPANYHDTNGRFPQLFKTFRKRISSWIDFDLDELGLGKTKNVRLITDSLYTFDDFTKKGRRLNIVAHGDFKHGKSFVEIRKNVVRNPEEMMPLILDQNLDLSLYKTARTITCYSGNIPEIGRPIGKVVAEGTGLRTKSYEGVVTAHLLFPYDIESPSRSKLFIRENKDGTFNFKTSHTIAKWSKGLANPVYFDP